MGIPCLYLCQHCGVVIIVVGKNPQNMPHSYTRKTGSFANTMDFRLSHSWNDDNLINVVYFSYYCIASLYVVDSLKME